MAGQIPIVVPVLVSFSMPLVCSTFGMFTKYVFSKNINALDFNFGYFIVTKGFFFLASLVYFSINGTNWRLYVIGFFGSIIDCMGCFFANSAVATGFPVGPIFALCDTQMLIVTVVSAIAMKAMPHWMQIGGLVVGTVGVSVLTKVFQSKNK